MKTKIRSKNYLLLLIFLSFLSSCATIPKKPLPTNLRPTQELLLTPIKTLNGLAQVTLRRGHWQRILDMAVLIEAPDKMRLTFLDDLGQIYYDFVLDGEIVYWQAESNPKIFQSSLNEFYSNEGPMNEIPMVDLLNLFMLHWDQIPDAKFSGDPRQPSSLIRYDGANSQKMLYRLDILDWKNENIPYPDQWVLFLVLKNIQMQLVWEKLVLNMELPKNRFLIQR